jgi:EAL domain-containing protein (putative c-di-GMP-specific phosphodiesterase class I)
MAFQPVVDLTARRVYAYEALVRGPLGESAAKVLGKVTPANRYAFDQSCRIKAITLASQLGLLASGASLSINFIPGAMYQPETCVRATLAAARRNQFPAERLIFELTENEEITDYHHLAGIFRVYRANQFRTALDDFGAGFSGLSLLANFQPDVVKIDAALIRGVDTDPRRRAIVEGIAHIGHSLSATVVAEGVETLAEMAALRSIGVSLFQGYLFARPGFETLPVVSF